MSEDDKRPDTMAERAGLTSQLRELERFIVDTEAAGEPLPAEAAEMVERLREIVRALDALTASLEREE